MSTLRSKILAGIAVLAMAGVVVLEARLASASCTLDTVSVPPQPTETTASGDNFSETIDVNRSHSPGTGTWTVHYAYTPGNSDNIAANPTVTPSQETYTLHSSQYTSGQEAVGVSGSLITGANGLFQLGFWDGSTWQCSGSHDLEVLR